MKRIILAGLAVILVCAVAAMIFIKRGAARQTTLVVVKTAPGTLSTPSEPPPATPSKPIVPPSPESAPSPQSAPAKDATTPEVVTDPKPQSAAPAAKPAKKAKDPLADPLAREALGLVGADLEAEIYWVAAINDPAIPSHERQDLIEDLNEDGLVDPKHPAAEDLPLILSRIELIEDLMPWALDKTNWEAFLEAYKDLWNLADLASGNGREVK